MFPIGLQSAVEEELNVLGRKHSAQDASETADQIRKAGIHNISLDLMVGISKQTKESLGKNQLIFARTFRRSIFPPIFLK